MIADNIRNAALYFGANKAFEKSFAKIKELLKGDLVDGKYEIDGDKLFYLVQSYNTIPESELKPEAHRKYIDIQFIVKGNETIGWFNIEGRKATTQYIEERDIIFFENTGNNWINMKDGDFAIFYPEDVHSPKCVWGEVQPIKKIIVKIAV